LSVTVVSFVGQWAARSLRWSFAAVSGRQFAAPSAGVSSTGAAAGGAGAPGTHRLLAERHAQQADHRDRGQYG
jgi:hypothetical protein